MSSSSSTQEQFAHLKIPLEEIVSATDNFSDANIIRSETFGNDYKGQLLRSGQVVDIVARRLDETRGFGEEEFWAEVSMLSRLEHQNIISIVGFCDENGEKIVVNKDDSPRGRLYGHLRDPTNLTWMRRLQICVDVGHALSYIHYHEGRDFSVIHRGICSAKILLDDKWEARLSGFEFSMTQAAAERNDPCQVGGYCGRVGYIDPTYKETGSVSHKSDMFSFGVVLFELLCGKVTKAIKEGEMYLYQRAISHYREGRLHNLLHPALLKQMDPQSLQIFSKTTAYECLNDQPSKRPNINQLLIELEIALECQREYEKYEQEQKHEFAHLKIPLEEIVSATHNFSDANFFRSDGFGNEYKGQLLRSGQLVDIVARRLDETRGFGKKQFWTEVSMLFRLEHQNIVSIVGFCDENGEKIVVNKDESPRGDLYNHLNNPTNLTWMRRLQICINVGHALSYIHFDEGHDFSVIHRDICSEKILLDDKWEARLSNFEFSITQAATERHGPCQVDMIHLRKGYTDPTYKRTRSVSNKSDMFSFGVVLFELLYCTGADLVKEDEMYLYQSAISHLNSFLHPALQKQMEPESLQIFSEIAYECLNDQPSKRPNIDQLLIELKKALECQREYEKYHETIEGSASKSLKIARLQIPLEEIVSATNNFSDANLIRRHGF